MQKYYEGLQNQLSVFLSVTCVHYPNQGRKLARKIFLPRTGMNEWHSNSSDLFRPNKGDSIVLTTRAENQKTIISYIQQQKNVLYLVLFWTSYFSTASCSNCFDNVVSVVLFLAGFRSVNGYDFLSSIN